MAKMATIDHNLKSKCALDENVPLSTNLFVHANHSWTKSSLHLSSECLINFTTGLLFIIRTAVFLVVLIITSFLIFTFSIM